MSLSRTFREEGVSLATRRGLGDVLTKAHLGAPRGSSALLLLETPLPSLLDLEDGVGEEGGCADPLSSSGTGTFLAFLPLPWEWAGGGVGPRGAECVQVTYEGSNDGGISGIS